MAKRDFPEKKRPNLTDPDVKVTSDKNFSAAPVSGPSEVVGSISDKTFAKVVGCEKLNVRNKPSITGNVLCTVAKNDVLTIDERKSTKEWYSVTTASGINGFCMRKYVGLEK
jgi:uncharacterized protein YgiM (DUF1202 family)